MRLFSLFIFLPTARFAQPSPSAPLPDRAPVLMGQTLRNQRGQACEGQRLVLKCPLHTHIVIVNAFYGRLVPSAELCPPTEKQLKKWRKKKKAALIPDYEDTSCDLSTAKAKVALECENRRKCKLRARAAEFGSDPCPSTSKYLQVAYQCQPSMFHSEVVCEGAGLRLSCRSKRQRIAIHSGFYGRKVAEKGVSCPASSAPLTHDCTVDAGDSLLRECHGKANCGLSVDDKILGSPCPLHVQKYLSLVYICVNENVFNDATLKGDWLEEEEEDLMMVEPPLPPPRPPSVSTPTLNNDAAYEPHPKPALVLPPSTEAGPSEAPIPVSGTCLPPSVPNAVGFVQSWILTADYMMAHRERLILYFSLSASVGLISLLVLCIARMCKKSRESGEETTETEPLNASLRSRLDILPVPSHTDDEREGSRMEMLDLGTNGVSFMRFSHPTPPRAYQHQAFYG